jgi:hypothetical protein
MATGEWMLESISILVPIMNYQSTTRTTTWSLDRDLEPMQEVDSISVSCLETYSD